MPDVAATTAIKPQSHFAGLMNWRVCPRTNQLIGPKRGDRLFIHHRHRDPRRCCLPRSTARSFRASPPEHANHKDSVDPKSKPNAARKLFDLFQRTPRSLTMAKLMHDAVPQHQLLLQMKVSGSSCTHLRAGLIRYESAR
eukprot:6189586-Pleurochrysis_carterae.AAC.4